MLDFKAIFIILGISFIIAFFIRIFDSFFIGFLVLFWILNLIYNIFSGRIFKEITIKEKYPNKTLKFKAKKTLFLYIEELISLVFLIPLFVVLKLNFLVYSFAVFGFAEIMIAGFNLFQTTKNYL